MARAKSTKFDTVTYAGTGMFLWVSQTPILRGWCTSMP